MIGARGKEGIKAKNLPLQKNSQDKKAFLPGLDTKAPAETSAQTERIQNCHFGKTK